MASLMADEEKPEVIVSQLRKELSEIKKELRNAKAERKIHESVQGAFFFFFCSFFVCTSFLLLFSSIPSSL